MFRLFASEPFRFNILWAFCMCWNLISFVCWNLISLLECCACWMKQVEDIKGTNFWLILSSLPRFTLNTCRAHLLQQINNEIVSHCWITSISCRIDDYKTFRARGWNWTHKLVEIEHINLLKGEQLSQEFVKLNSLHQVPALVDVDFVLSESRAIQAYLVNLHKPGSSLYPNDAKSRASVDQMLYFDATVVFPTLKGSLVKKIH